MYSFLHDLLRHLSFARSASRIRIKFRLSVSPNAGFSRPDTIPRTHTFNEAAIASTAESAESAESAEPAESAESAEPAESAESA